MKPEKLSCMKCIWNIAPRDNLFESTFMLRKNIYEYQKFKKKNGTIWLFNKLIKTEHSATQIIFVNSFPWGAGLQCFPSVMAWLIGFTAKSNHCRSNRTFSHYWWGWSMNSTKVRDLLYSTSLFMGI